MEIYERRQGALATTLTAASSLIGRTRLNFIQLLNEIIYISQGKKHMNIFIVVISQNVIVIIATDINAIMQRASQKSKKMVWFRFYVIIIKVISNLFLFKYHFLSTNAIWLCHFRLVHNRISDRKKKKYSEAGMKFKRDNEKCRLLWWEKTNFSPKTIEWRLTRKMRTGNAIGSPRRMKRM